MEVYLELMAIKDIPINERPREKLERYGSEKLSEVELLSIIIGSGTKGFSALDIAHTLIHSQGLYNLSITPYEDFKNIKGIDKVNALKLEALFELYKRLHAIEIEHQKTKINSDYIVKKYQPLLMDMTQEVMGLIIVDKDNSILSEKILFMGTNNHVSVSNKEIFKELLRKSGKRFYIFHNHPSNDASPSDHDVVFTANLIKECRRFDYELIDHLIISKESFFSFAGHESL